MFSRRLNTILMLAILAVVAITLVVVAITQPAAPASQRSAPAVEAPVVEQMHSTATPEQAFIADLFGPDTDVSPDQVFVLTELAQRYCTFVVRGQIVPGADVQTRADYVATLTMPEPSMTTGWSLDEANKFLDVAEGAYCPPSPRG